MTGRRFIGTAGPPDPVASTAATALGMTVAPEHGGVVAGTVIIHYTYCWQLHHVPSLQWWIENDQVGCGRDESRYPSSHADYIAYVRQYKAGWDEKNSRVAVVLPVQSSLFEVSR